MPTRYPCGGLGRRTFLSGAVLPLVAGLHTSAQEPRQGAGAAERLGVPRPYPRRGIEGRHPAMIKAGVKSREAIQATVDRGLKELTGADDAVGAWRSFFEPGDVVGIKMNPVGNPLANSSSELMLAVIDGLKSAGVKTKDMIVF